MIDLKNISIVGGGTAGWLTALYVSKLLPNTKITLIESESVGILGAGEATTPHLIGLLYELGITPTELILEAEASYKLGVSFENWNGDGEKFFHPLGTIYNVINREKFNLNLNKDYEYLIIDSILNGTDFNKIFPCSALAEQNKSPIPKVDDAPFVDFALHFNAAQLAKFLRKKCESIGVTRVEGKVREFKQDEQGFITSISLENEKVVDCDFVFDCSGFARLIIGKLYKTGWKSYQKHLPVKAAIPFFLESEKDKIRPYSRAISMKYGWMWQAALPSRIGAGYIFDTDFISPEQAQQEAEEFLGHPVDPLKLFKFDAGRYEKVWVKNCIAVGLSSGFAEPLEATALMITMQQLIILNSSVSAMYTRHQPTIDIFNKHYNDLNDNVVNFLAFHYICKRNDTDFWKRFKDKEFLPEKLKELMDIWKYRAPRAVDDVLIWKIFGPDNYMIVGHHKGAFDTSLWKKEFEIYGGKNNPIAVQEHIDRVKRGCELFIENKEYLDNLQSQRISQV